MTQYSPYTEYQFELTYPFQLREVLTHIANEVQKNEPGLHKYHFFEQYDGEKGNVFIAQETCMLLSSHYLPLAHLQPSKYERHV